VADHSPCFRFVVHIFQVAAGDDIGAVVPGCELFLDFSGLLRRNPCLGSGPVVVCAVRMDLGSDQANTMYFIGKRFKNKRFQGLKCPFVR
jgi:hypothetical protein